MFGDNLIYGQTVVHTDAKTRLVLPAFTKASSKDELLIVKDPRGIKIMPQDQLDKKVAKLEEIFDRELDEEKRVKLGNLLFNIYSSILKPCVCDNNKRIVLKDILKPSETYLVIGCRKSILIQDHETNEVSAESKILGKEYKPNL